MNILFFECTNDWMLIESFYASDGGLTKLAHLSELSSREASNRLVPEIQRILEKSNILKPDLIVTCIGPGSFTGIRICVSIGRNLSQLWKIPVWGIDSLEMYAHYYYEKFHSPIAIILDGKQNKVYAGTFNGIYSGSIDVELNVFFNRIELSEYKICTNLKSINSSFFIHSEIPSAESILKQKQIEMSNLSFEQYSYSQLLPNYIRRTYAEKQE